VAWVCGSRPIPQRNTALTPRSNAWTALRLAINALLYVPSGLRREAFVSRTHQDYNNRTDCASLDAMFLQDAFCVCTECSLRLTESIKRNAALQPPPCGWSGNLYSVLISCGVYEIESRTEGTEELAYVPESKEKVHGTYRSR
jgi:hypothetical protein